MMDKLFHGFGGTLTEVALALAPLLLCFIIFQIFFLKLKKQKVIQILAGFVSAFAGLAFFLHGVHLGFMPIGEEMGKKLGNLPYSWIIIPIGFVLGFVTTLAEPAVKILNKQVEKVTSGYISEKIMLITLSGGVGLAIALAMLRIHHGFSLWYYLAPGYALALILIYFSNSSFVSIAFDSGGVATGPMTVTFILSMAVGAAAVTEGRDPLTDGFGLIALVALIPILAVLILGLLFKRKEGAS
ncbi:DUF1538 domain-containing protein [Bacillus infantis]|uniref:DUF1538 domain-containing protein n=1 Tax=Bacillus infantis TaxID=324767 RepID=UPI003CF06ACA